MFTVAWGLLGGSGGCRLHQLCCRAQQGLITSPCSSHCSDGVNSLVSLELPLLPGNAGRDKGLKAAFLLSGLWERPRKPKQLFLHCQGCTSVQTDNAKQEPPVPEPSQAGTARCSTQQVTPCRAAAHPTGRNTQSKALHR